MYITDVSKIVQSIYWTRCGLRYLSTVQRNAINKTRRSYFLFRRADKFARVLYIEGCKVRFSAVLWNRSVFSFQTLPFITHHNRLISIYRNITITVETASDWYWYRYVCCTAVIGLTPNDSSAAHVYTQTVGLHSTTEYTQHYMHYMNLQG
jgi:hypothetical protein